LGGTAQRDWAAGRDASAARTQVLARASGEFSTEAILPFVGSANLDLVRSICAEWERGLYGSVEWAHPEIELVIEDLPASGSWKGLAAAVQAWREFLDAWEGHRIEVDEYRELDGERVLTLGTFRARGKASRVDLEQLRTTGANLFYIRAGQVTKLVIYFDREHALADLGLAPQARSPDS
jgi:hypothetical protein